MNGRHNTVEDNISVADRAASQFSKQASLLGIPFDDVQQESRMAMLRLLQTEPDASAERVWIKARDGAREFMRRERDAKKNFSQFTSDRELACAA